MTALDDIGGRLAELVEDADHILLGAGAGLTGAAGIDYGDATDFEQTFPQLWKEGFRARYQMIGRFDWPVERHWAFWGTHVWDVRFRERRFPLYERLAELLRGRDVFVHTSNVDALFERHGLSADRVHTPQGAYAAIQCRRPCLQRVWDSQPFIERILESLDPAHFVTAPEAVPRCPNCGGEMFLNVRVDRSFVEVPYGPQRQRLGAWLEGATGGLLMLEFGAGFNTPSVVRWPLERLAAERKAPFVRINPEHFEVPSQLGAWSVPHGADAVIEAWAAATPAIRAS